MSFWFPRFQRGTLKARDTHLHPFASRLACIAMSRLRLNKVQSQLTQKADAQERASKPARRHCLSAFASMNEPLLACTRNRRQPGSIYKTSELSVWGLAGAGATASRSFGKRRPTCRASGLQNGPGLSPGLVGGLMYERWK